MFHVTIVERHIIHYLPLKLVFNKQGDNIIPPQCYQQANSRLFIRHGAHHVLEKGKKIVYKKVVGDHVQVGQSQPAVRETGIPRQNEWSEIFWVSTIGTVCRGVGNENFMLVQCRKESAQFLVPERRRVSGIVEVL